MSPIPPGPGFTPADIVAAKGNIVTGSTTPDDETLGKSIAGSQADIRLASAAISVPVLASHSMWFDGSTVTDAGRATRYRHIALRDIVDPVLLYVNPAETSSPVTVYAGLEYPALTYYKLHFAGEAADRGKSVAGGSWERTQPLGIKIKKGDVFYTNTTVVPTAAASYPTMTPPGFVQNNVAETSGQRCVTATTTDYAASANPGTAGSSLYGYGPVAVLGSPATATLRAHAPFVGVEGDSISVGTGDNQAISGFANFEAGWITRALIAAGLPYLNLGISGQAGNGYYAAPTQVIRMRKAIMAACSHVIWEYVTNDLIGNVAFATFGPNFLGAWSELSSRGAKVLASTCTPRTTSTDSWATTVNQTAANAKFGPETTPSDRQQYNAWLRDGAPTTIATNLPAAVGATAAGIARCDVYGPAGTRVSAASGASGHPLFAVIDVAAVVEVLEPTSNTWVWQVGTTADGIHPSATAHAAMAAAVPVNAIV